ncbi:MAG: HNH endonuclease [Flavobacterium sp.]|nr:MAG: HNH endonuclease [Flavobacterium sp.]
MNNLSSYLHQLLHLNRASHPKLGKAPHKPVLLLSVLQLVRERIIDSNRIFITADLVIAFKSNWELLVTTGHIPTFALPFFHLRSEPFWRVEFVPGMGNGVTSISSFAALKRIVAFAEIDQELFNLMADPVTADVIENALLDFYFQDTKYNYKDASQYSIATEIETEIVNEPAAVYQERMIKIEESGADIEEERFIRNSIFKKQVPKIYGYRCCISGMKLEAGFNVQMVDACHIMPFSLSRNDTISNGISLAPNLHRAFDRGLITITANFRVRISRSFKENDSPFSLGQFADRILLLPELAKDYPAAENLIWHNKERFVL